jgi:magnesium-transporting ATPase (P-type)
MEIVRLTVNEVLKALDTSAAGLSPEEARRRLAHYGPNSLQEAKGPSLTRRFPRQFTHFLAILLWVAVIGNIFGGRRTRTFFGQLGANDNLTLTVRYEC